MTILLSFGCLILSVRSAEAAMSCRDLLSGIKSVFVDKRSEKAMTRAENEFQKKAVLALQEAGFFGQLFYETALKISNEFQLEIIRDLISKKAIFHSVWTAVPKVKSELQKQAYYAIRNHTYEYFEIHEQYIQDIKTPEQLEILKDLLRTGTPSGNRFWFRLNEKRVREEFKNGLSEADIVAFTKLDGISPSVAKELELIMLRFSKRDIVIGNVELLMTRSSDSSKSSHFLSDGSFYVKIEVQRKDDRLLIAVHDINIAHRGLRFGERSNGLSQKASETIAVILLFAARQAKKYPEIREIELLGQNIVNIDFIWALRKRLFHVENRKDIPNFSDYKETGLYLRASILNAPTFKSQSIPELTLSAITNGKYDANAYQDIVASFSNVYQYWAVREIVQKKENLKDAIHSISKIQNQYQVRALQILIDNNKDYFPLMNELLKIDNPYQAQVLNYLASVIDKNSKLIELITQVSNQYQVKAVEELIRNKKNPTLLLGSILSVENDEQLRSFLIQESGSKLSLEK